jgi:hypothetical protein
MGTAFVMSGLRHKRAHLAGEIEAEEKRQAERRYALATLDAVIRMFEPQSNPDLIAPIRPCTIRNLFVRRGEQMRLVIQALREAAQPIPCRQVVNFCIAAKGLHDLEPQVRAQMTEHIRATLVRLAERGVARKIVERPDTWWGWVAD